MWIFSKEKRDLRKINRLRDSMKKLSDQELINKTSELKSKVKNGKSLKSVKHEAFAVSREACWRVLNKEPYDVQVLGGLALADGNVAEMKTGEGKTLTAVMPAYLHALTGRGVHIITVNDYLAQRDKEEMGKVFEFLGMSADWIYPDMPTELKQKAYQADVLYGTNQEFGFDYLRDNLAVDKSEMVQRPLYYAIVDEVDSILIDEARTPLIISGQNEDDVTNYVIADRVVKKLKRGADIQDETMLEKIMRGEETTRSGDFAVERKTKTVILTDRGIAKVEKAYKIDNLGEAENGLIMHHVQQALKANYAMEKNVDYLVADDEVVIVDDFTGRAMEGRRFSDGLHQALEAKEQVTIKGSDDTKASITLQNFFRLYEKLSGMTGTAKTEEEELKEVYDLKVKQIPTNKPVIREDKKDRIFASKYHKYQAILDDVSKQNAKGRPILIGTVSVEQSEDLSRFFTKKGIPHEVLNAKNHEKEAMIISQAGKSSSVTIATNMAGRGTDILLGGNPEYLAKGVLEKEGYTKAEIEEIASHVPTEDEELLALRDYYQELLKKYRDHCEIDKQRVVEAGGLHVIGTQRHDSRRIDNQLRGRAGRQGDPGSSQFFLSMDDDLIKVFDNERFKKMKEEYKDVENGEIQAFGIRKVFDNLQKRVEAQDYESRKNVLEYDEVDDIQRSSIYEMRSEVIDMDFDFKKFFEDAFYVTSHEWMREIVKGNDKVSEHNFAAFTVRLFDYIELGKEDTFKNDHHIDLELKYFEDPEEMRKELERYFYQILLVKESFTEWQGMDIKQLHSIVALSAIDLSWANYLIATQNLKDSTRMAAYGNTQPIDVYKNSCIEMFDDLMVQIDVAAVRLLMNVRVGGMM